MSVLEEWGMACPCCGCDSKIEIVARVWVLLCEDGTDITAPGIGDHEWDNESPTVCRNCDFAGRVGDFLAQDSSPERRIPTG